MPEGRQVVFMNAAGSVSQELTNTLEANMEYSLEVSVGDRLDTVCGPYSVELWAGTNLLGAASPPTVSGAFVSAKVTCTVGTTTAGIGSPLLIVLSKVATVHGDTVNFDAVVLSSTPTLPPLLEVVPAGGDFVTFVQVTLVSTVAEAEIRYTLDGTEPTTNSAVYGAPLRLEDTTTLRARLFLNGTPASEVQTATFTELPAVVFDPPGGWFTNSVPVTMISRVPGADIRFTVDGSEPSTNATLFVAPVTLYQTTTIQARLFVNGFPVSDTVTTTIKRLPDVVIEPAGGDFTNSVQVICVNHLGIGTVLYTLDGSDPTPSSAVYTGPVTLEASAVFRARIFFNGFPTSEVSAASFLRIYAIDDGVPNDWRERYFGPDYRTDPRVSGNADPDGDGWTNLLEYEAGTDPTDATLKPEIAAGIRAIPLVTWNSLPGFTYQVLRKSSLSETNWTVVLPSLIATNTTSQYIDEAAPSTSVYLIELVP